MPKNHFVKTIFCNVNLCFSRQDYLRNKGCIYHILNTSVESGRSTTTHFFLPKLFISEHSGSIGICIKKAKKSTFNFLSAKGAEGSAQKSS